MSQKCASETVWPIIFCPLGQQFSTLLIWSALISLAWMGTPGIWGDSTLVVSLFFHITCHKHFPAQIIASLRPCPEVHLLRNPQQASNWIWGFYCPKPISMVVWDVGFPGTGSQGAHQPPEDQAISLLLSLPEVQDPTTQLPALGNTGIILTPSQK